MKPSKPWRRADFGIPESAVLLMFVGRLFEEKNLATLLKQFAIAADIIPDLHLGLVGRGPDAEELKELAQALGYQDQIHFYGPLDYEEIPNILAAADIFVTASISEVHPLTVIEAMAAGLPVAATRSPGVIDSVENNVAPNGMFVNLVQQKPRKYFALNRYSDSL